MPQRRLWVIAIVVATFLFQPDPIAAGDPKQTDKNTYTLQLANPIEPLRFSRPLKFHVQDVEDRTGNSPPRLVLRSQGGVYLSREPREIVREWVELSLQSAGLLAADAASADYWLTVYLHHFGHASGIAREYFFKVDLSVLAANRRTGESEKITTLGTSITRNKKQIQLNMETALVKALRGFLRGARFGEVIIALEKSASAQQARAAAEATPAPKPEPAPPPKESAAPAPAEVKPPPDEPGTVLVSSTFEGAEVYVDEGYVGNTPARVKLAPGKYLVRVVMTGQDDWTRQLAVLPGSELKVFAHQTAPAKSSPPAPNPKALSKEAILNLLRNFVPSTRVTALVQEQGIKFAPTEGDLNEIAEAGGGNDLLEALRRAAAPVQP
jgi:hypothetical protein